MYKTYLKYLISIIIILFGGAYMYAWYYAKYYPLPLSSRISLDAKMQFVRDMPNREQVDTIIFGSSIGLNNINGPVLKQTSSKIKHLLNMSAFSMEITHTVQLVALLDLFPRLERVIYSAQSLDFTSTTPFDDVDIDLLKEYIVLGKEQSDFTYTFLAYKNFINIVKRRWNWESKYLVHNSFLNLDFDVTGSAGLHIYGKDIIPRRWNNPFVQETSSKSYRALGKMIDEVQKKGAKFYFCIEPYRASLVKKDKRLKHILDTFNDRAEAVVHEHSETFVNFYRTLHLQDKYFADRIHLNDTGNKIIAKAIARIVDTREKE